jgi:glycosyltransferase involved in cell wall biosynthesis
MKNETLVSVCMITYNHEFFIAQALDSILMQKTDFEYEVVIGEDCSSDNTREILLRYKKKYPDKFKLLLHDENKGMMLNSFMTLQECKGQYIALLEGDDYWTDPIKLQYQIDEMQKNPLCGISFHSSTILSDTIEIKKIANRRAKENKIFSTSEIIYGGDTGCFCHTASFVFKSEIIEKLPDFYKNAPLGDYFLQILCSMDGGALYLDKVMSVYRVNTSGSWSESMQTVEKRKLFFKRFLSTLDDLNIFLNGNYKKEINFIIERQYFDIALFFLRNKKYNCFMKYLNDFFNINNSFKMKLLYFIGVYTRSAWLFKKTDKLLQILESKGERI